MAFLHRTQSLFSLSYHVTPSFLYLFSNFWQSMVDLLSASLVSPIPVVSCHPSTDLIGSVGVLRFRPSFKPATCSIWTMMRVAQQACLASMLKTGGRHVCWIQDTCNCVVRTTYPLNASAKLNSRMSGDPKAAAFGRSDVRIALSNRTETALGDLILMDCQSYAERLWSPFKVSSYRLDTCSVLVFSVYVATGYTSDAIKDIFFQKQLDLPQKPNRADFMLLEKDMNARVDRRSLNETHLWGLLVSIFSFRKPGTTVSFVQLIAWFPSVVNSHIRIAGTLPDVRLLRVTNRPRSCTSQLTTNPNLHIRMASSTGALPLIPTTC